MRRILKDMYGTDTGARYKDGSPVKVGDRLSIRRTERPATVRVRMNEGRIYYYATYWEFDRTYTRSLAQIQKEGFAKYVGKELERKPEIGSRLKWKPDTEGEFIFGLEEYDTAIYGKVI